MRRQMERTVEVGWCPDWVRKVTLLGEGAASSQSNARSAREGHLSRRVLSEKCPRFDQIIEPRVDRNRQSSPWPGQSAFPIGRSWARPGEAIPCRLVRSVPLRPGDRVTRAGQHGPAQTQTSGPTPPPPLSAGPSPIFTRQDGPIPRSLSRGPCQTPHVGPLVASSR